MDVKRRQPSSFCFLWLEGPATVVVAAPSLTAARSIVAKEEEKKPSDEARDLARIVSTPPELTVETRSTEWAGIVLEHHLVTRHEDDVRGGIFYVNADPVKPRGDPNKSGGLWPPRKEPAPRRRGKRRQRRQGDT